MREWDALVAYAKKEHKRRGKLRKSTLRALKKSNKIFKEMMLSKPSKKAKCVKLPEATWRLLNYGNDQRG